LWVSPLPIPAVADAAGAETLSDESAPAVGAGMYAESLNPAVAVTDCV
jgi:hypothetical protein